MSSPTIVAIVPMRHNSERVPGKNYRLFAEKPLYHHIVTTLLNCPSIQQVVIDTDSPIIQEQTAQHFPQVKVLERPLHLRDGGVAMNDVLLHTTAQLSADFFLQTHSTNPLLTADTLERAIATFLKGYPMYDSMFSVTRWQTRLWDGLARPLNHNANILLRTQDLPPVYEENSLFYLFNRTILQERHNRVGLRPLLFEVDRLEAQDIDEEVNFIVAEMIYHYRQQQASTKG